MIVQKFRWAGGQMSGPCPVGLAKHFRIRRAACGFTRCRSTMYNIRWPDGVYIYDRQVRRTIGIVLALLDCSMDNVRLLLDDIYGSTGRSDLSVSLQTCLLFSFLVFNGTWLFYI